MKPSSKNISTALPWRVSSTPLSVLLPFIGACTIALCSQLRIDLGFTPVPITGQTFAVVLWGMMFGRVQGALAACTYLLAGVAGLPVFAGFTSITALWGPTSGYLLGFIPGAWLAGLLSERVGTSNVVANILVSLAAHTPILLVGALVMWSFVGISQLFALAIAPFLLGDVIKSVAAAIVTSGVRKVRHGA